jgi:hypothetical protein
MKRSALNLSLKALQFLKAIKKSPASSLVKSGQMFNLAGTGKMAAKLAHYEVRARWTSTDQGQMK